MCIQEGVTMQCSRTRDEELAGQKMDVLYGEADAETRAAVEAHLAECAACRQEMESFGQVRRSLGAWTREDRGQPLVVRPARRLPAWLAAAAGLVLGLGVGVAYASLGDASVRGELAALESRTLEREQGYRDEVARLRAALDARDSESLDGALLERVDRRVDDTLREGLAAQERRLEATFAEWSGQMEAQRRVDMARVAAGLSYLDGQHGQQVARTNELMSYVLDTTQGGPR
jgi:anti-sigma factor RsiW